MFSGNEEEWAQEDRAAASPVYRRDLIARLRKGCREWEQRWRAARAGGNAQDAMYFHSRMHKLKQRLERLGVRVKW